jgi:bifunctional DNase/RNase
MLVEMRVAGLTIDPLTNMPILLLKDLDEQRTVPIWIGLVEASAIATELQQVKLERPMTHDLVRNLFERLGVETVHVEITDLRDNTYYATLVLQQGGEVIDIDARPSDAIAIAMRTGCAIYVDERVLEKASVLDLRTTEGPLEAREPGTDVLSGIPEAYFGKWKM